MALYDDILREANRAGRAATQMGPESGINMGASVVPPLYSQYNPAGAYAEAGRTVPNRASEQAMAMNQLTQPQGGVPSDLHNWNDPYGRPDAGYPGAWQENMGFPHGITAQGAVDPATGQMRVVPPDTSVVVPPRMPTEKETLDRGVMGPANERDRVFHALHQAWAEGIELQGIGAPQEYVDIYMSVPDEAKQYAHDNPTDAILQQFEEKYGFPLDVSVEIIR